MTATDILTPIVTAKAKTDHQHRQIDRATERLKHAELELQVARRHYHEIVGPYPLRWRFKGPFREAFDFADWLYYTLMFGVAAIITFVLMQLVGWASMFILGIAAVHIASHMRFRWARFTNWANAGRRRA